MVSSRTHLSIGDVLTLLREEFPDVTISKIRFLESQGLVNPERSPSGYRKFFERDVERLRWVLRQQREHFLPLKVIRDRLIESGGGVPADEDSAEALPAAEPAVPEEGRSITAGVLANGATEHLATGLRVPEPALLLSQGVGHHPGGAGAGERSATGRPGSRAAGGQEPISARGEDGRQEAALIREAVRDALPGLSPPSSPPGPGGEPRAPQTPVAKRAPVSAAAPVEVVGGETSGSGKRSQAVAASRPGAGRAVDAGPRGGQPVAHGTGPDAGGTATGAGGPAAGEPDLPSAPDPRTAPSSRQGRPAAGQGWSVEAGSSSEDPSGEEPGVPFDLSSGVSGASLTMEELCAATDLTASDIASLEAFGLIETMTVAGTTYYDESALAVANLVSGFGRYGIEPRHLRLYRNAVERESGLIEQVVAPLLRQRNPESRQRAAEAAVDLGKLGQSLRSALLRKELRRLIG